ncbi:MAG: helix-turn-helix domain-containing protein [Bryobacteraceae bacterium]
MFSIGQRLREERLRKGIKLSEISDFTRIRTGFLEAIENDQFDQLPGAFYARSFIRQYARYIGLDDPELEAEIQRQLGEPGPVVSTPELIGGLSVSGPEKTPVLWRTQPASRRLAYATAVLLVVAAILGIYLGWRQARARVEAQLRAAQEVPTPTAFPASSPAVAETGRSGIPASTAAGPAQPPASSAQTAEQPAPASPSPTPQPPLSVELTADKASWIQVQADGKVVFADTLQAGQSRTFQASERIRILTGNAGGLRIVRNGVPLGPAGPEGQVRTIELTQEGYTISAPKPKPPAAETEPSASPTGGETPPSLPLNPQ